MGKTSDELQREIADQRARIERRISGMEGRVRHDLRDTASGIAETAADQTHLREQAEQRPLTMVAGALGVGMLLGILTPQGNGPGNGVTGSARSGGGLIDQLMDMTSGAVGTTLRDELRELTSNIFGNGKNANGSKAAASSAESNERQSFSQPIGSSRDGYDVAQPDPQTTPGFARVRDFMPR